VRQDIGRDNQIPKHVGFQGDDDGFVAWRGCAERGVSEVIWGLDQWSTKTGPGLPHAPYQMAGTSPILAAVSSAVRAERERDLERSVESSGSDQTLENPLQRVAISSTVRDADGTMLLLTSAMTLGSPWTPDVAVCIVLWIPAPDETH